MTGLMDIPLYYLIKYLYRIRHSNLKEIFNDIRQFIQHFLAWTTLNQSENPQKQASNLGFHQEINPGAAPVTMNWKLTWWIVQWLSVLLLSSRFDSICRCYQLWRKTYLIRLGKTLGTVTLYTWLISVKRAMMDYVFWIQLWVWVLLQVSKTFTIINLISAFCFRPFKNKDFSISLLESLTCLMGQIRLEITLGIKNKSKVLKTPKTLEMNSPEAFP